MDYHILTKKQAECLKQIQARGAISSFFEPLRVVRELEALVLIRRIADAQFDSGFGYELTGAGMALSPFEAGTKYFFRDGNFVLVERPAQSEEVQRLQSDLQKRDMEIGLSNERIRELQRQRDEALNEREKSQQDAKILSDANHRQYQALHEKGAVIAQLQKTVDDYAQRNKINLQVIRNLEKNVDDKVVRIKDLELQLDTRHAQWRMAVDKLESCGWIGTFGDKRLNEGTYVFRNSQGAKPSYVVGFVTRESDHCCRCRDRLDQPINLNQFTEAMRLDQ